MELAYIAGAVPLLVALIYGANRYRNRSDPARQQSEQIVEDRYKRNDN